MIPANLILTPIVQGSPPQPASSTTSAASPGHVVGPPLTAPPTSSLRRRPDLVPGAVPLPHDRHVCSH